MFKRLREDIEVVFEQDPAARGYFEVILTYSGLHAVWAHRIAHAFYKRNFFFLARFVSQVSRFLLALRSIQEQLLVDAFYRSWNGSCNWRNL